MLKPLVYPFWPPIEYPYSVHDRVITDFIIQSWDVDRCGVSYRGRFIHFRPEDVALVLGLKCHGHLVDYYNDDGWFKEAIIGYEPKYPQTYLRLFKWEIKNFIIRGLVGKVHLLVPETLAEQELLVASHGSNVQSDQEPEHLRDRVSHLEAEL
ncbi:hypothetical protein H6P81_009851 [Aristolochia fimbriata]|uniref:Uncharacterized protein n=1 Tax=Aristolochia fimbriata TaxID=158543 RepID=A0AAV7EN62_ARIFI|nr:hypothetical protein H6P81_009851 [Aristolochia fimbriata]